MALITIQSFDPHLWGVDQFYDGWTEFNGSNSTTGRRSTNGIALVLTTGYFQYDPSANINVGIVGFAFYFGLPTQSANREFLAFRDGTTEQCKIRLNTDFSLSILTSAGTVIATSDPAVVTPQYWHYLEVKVEIDGAGAYEIRLDEQTVLSGVNADLQATGNSYFTNLRLQYMGGTSPDPTTYDDFYLCDDTGSDFNDFQGDVEIDTLYVDGAGFQADWTPLSGSNYQMVDEGEGAFDEDTTYNSSNTPGEIDLFTMTNLPDINGSTILAVAVDVGIRHDSGTPTARAVLRTDGSNYEGPNYSTSGGYTYMRWLMTTNPDTSVQWLEAEVNAMQAGYKYQA